MKQRCVIFTTLAGVLLLSMPVPVHAQPAKLPVKVSAKRRYLVDQNGTPFLRPGDNGTGANDWVLVLDAGPVSRKNHPNENQETLTR